MTLWDLVPEEERECQLRFIHLLSRGDVSEQLHVPQACARPWCGKCESIRVWRIRHRIHKYLEHHRPMRSWLVTKSVKNEFRLRDAFTYLHYTNNRWTTLCRRLENNPLKVVTCWIATYEITWKQSTGYHLHQHAVVGTNGERLDYALMHILWNKAAGYKAQLDFRQIGDVRGAVDYISKYISKGCWGGLSRGRAYQMRDTLFGRNRVVCKHGTAVREHIAKFYVCCMPPDKTCVSWGAWDPPSTEEGR